MLNRTPKWAKDAARRSLAELELGKMPNQGRDSKCRKTIQQGSTVVEQSVFVATVGAEGVLDTGASRTVVGSGRVRDMLQGLPAECRREVRQVKSDITFRFGNSGTLSAKHALLLPAAGSTWVRVEIVPGDTPLLISNRLLRHLDAVIHVKKGILSLGAGAKIPLRFDERGLSIVDLAAVLMAPQAVAHLIADAAEQADKVTSSSPIDTVSTHQLATNNASTTSKQVHQQSEQPLPSPVVCGQARDSSHFRCDDHACIAEQGCREAPGQDARDQHGRTPIKAEDAQLSVETQCLKEWLTVEYVRPAGVNNLQEWSQITVEQGKHRGLEFETIFDKDLRYAVVRLSVSKDTAKPDSRRWLSSRATWTRRPRGRVHGQRRVEGVPEAGADGEEQVGWSHGSATSEFNGATGSGKGKLQETHSAVNLLQDGGRTRSRSASHAQGDARAGAPALERGRASSRERGSAVMEPNGSPEGRGKGPGTDMDLQDMAGIQALCERIESSILQIEHQLSSEVRSPHEVAHKYRMPALDVLEVAQLGSGMLGQALKVQGHRVITLQQERDLVVDFKKLWRAVNMYEPEHIWISLARPWKHRHGPKVTPFWPEDLLRELFYYQVERGRHLHILGNPDIFHSSSDHLAEVLQGMLCLVHQPSETGKNAVPSGNNHLCKKTIVYTTSRAIQQALDTRISRHQVNKTSQIPDKPTSQPTQKPPQQSGRRLPCLRFAEKVGHCLKCPVGMPLAIDELLIGEHKREGSDSDRSSAKQVLKRRRLLGKQSVPQATPVPEQDTWSQVFQMVNSDIPPKGRVYFQEGDAVANKAQALLPDMIVKHLVFCRGVNRIQPAPVEVRPKEVPLRYTVVVKRVGGEIVADKHPEDWSRIPKYKRGSACVPAKIALTVYGSRPVMRDHQQDNSQTSPVPGTASTNSNAAEPAVSTAPMVEQPSTAVESFPLDQPSGTAEVEMQDGQGSREVSRDIVQGYPPRSIPRHGPGYLELSKEQKTELSRLHHNLGHPAVGVFVKFLQERKAEPALIRGARDYCCATCLETVPSLKPSRPASIHLDGDFGDVVGMDVAYWTGKAGQQHVFTHVVDEATLFQQAVATGRTPEEQFAVLADTWFQWTGPCKVLYIDPAGEYNSDFWRLQLQREGVRANVSAGEAHWQLGRTEKHGSLLKSMLTRMDGQETIKDAEDFKRCLREAVRAKNALSRVKGYTPEQAVLGKMSRVPGSIISDDNAATHSLADSDLPEGVAFRRDLQRREQARVAFAQADNDCAYRRALLRRSRPRTENFEAGDWVLYWRRQRGGTRGERGRWYGPGQVLSGDSRVVYVSHCGQLIRAAPEQLRSASMREWQAISNVAQGSAQPRQLVDLSLQGEIPARAEVESEGPPPVARPAAVDVIIAPQREAPSTAQVSPGVAVEQPEMETSLAASETADGEVPVLEGLEPADIPVPEEDDDEEVLFGDTECFLVHPQAHQVWEIGVHETDIEPHNLPSPTQALHYVMLATQDRKKRVEVRLRDLSAAEQEQFRQAKSKEVGAWLDHATVRKVAAGTLDDQQLMRCRWILSWKGPEKEGGPRRAKARLVVLGFEDPDIATIPNDAPTLQLILQKVVSNKWRLINFDVSTAFLQGKGDGRKLGIRPPPELREALKMHEHEQCMFEGGAYGRVDAPFLWFQTFKETLESLGFVQCPFDACTFSLVTPQTDGSPKVHGVLGIHVDDGIGGGDSYFGKVIQELRAIYNFGSYEEGEFTFTGIHFRQWLDGSIEMDQISYVEKIAPIHVPRERRVQPNATLTPGEVKELRRLNGSLQYAAVHTRPDISAKVGFLQTRINKGEVQHLLEANRVLHETKTHRVSLMIVPIPEERVTFCTFSDASFATSKDNNSYQGTLVVAADWRMLANEQAVMVPVAWCSKKISRVVRSTLSAEVVSLSGSIDRMSWLRLLWEWLKDPSVDLANPEKILQKAPQASLVTDCKSAYDISTKTAVPNCSELRTQLECLLLRERLQENCKLRWVHSRAMLADCLTRVMDSAELRRRLSSGKYTLCDEQEVLNDRADHRQSLKWLREPDNLDSDPESITADTSEQCKT